MSGTNHTESRVAILGPVVVSIFAEVVFVLAITVAWWTKDPSLGILLGAASAQATTAAGYWLGSSSGSRAKDKTIADQATGEK